MSVVPSVDLQELANTQTFRGLDADTLSGLLERSTRREHARGEVVREAGAGRGEALLLARGAVRLDRISPEGEPASVDVLGPGAMHGDVPGSPDPGLKCRVVAILNGSVTYRQRASDLGLFLRSRPALLERAAAPLGYAATRAHDRIDAVASRPVLIRLAHLLCELAKLHPEGRITETQEELAALIMASPRQVRREIAALKRRGLVMSAPNRPGLVVRDPEGLVREIDPYAG